MTVKGLLWGQCAQLDMPPSPTVADPTPGAGVDLFPVHVSGGLDVALSSARFFACFSMKSFDQAGDGAEGSEGVEGIIRTKSELAGWGCGGAGLPF